MTETEVRAHLRGATKEGVLDGWNNHKRPTNMGPKLFWTITTADKDTFIYDDTEIRKYCFMIKEAGIEPVFLRGQMP